jgi:hypothetical protein
MANPWSDVLRHWRTVHCGESYDRAAARLYELTGPSRADIKSLGRGWRRWENGTYPCSYASELEELTNVPPGTFDRRFALAQTPGDALTVAAGDALNWEDEEMRRRNLLRGLSAMAAGLGLAAVAPVRGSAATKLVGMSDVDEIQGMTSLFRGWDYQYGGGEILADATLYADRVSTLLLGNYSAGVEASLHQAIGQLRQLVGWAAFDTGNLPEARRHWLNAQASARQAKDAPLQARILYCFGQEARQRGDWASMGEYLEEGLEIAGKGNATNTVVAMLSGFVAIAHAAQGKPRLALNRLGMADTAMNHTVPSEDPPWARFFGPAEFMSATAHVHREIGRTQVRYRTKALADAVVALELYDQTQARSRALVTVTAAGTAFLAGEPEMGIQLARDALEQDAHLQSTRVIGRLRTLASEMAPFAKLPTVQALGRDLAAI